MHIACCLHGDVSSTHCICDTQKYIGGKYQLPDETELEIGDAGTDGKKHKLKKGKRLAVTSLLRSEPTALARTAGTDATAPDDTELSDESLAAEDAPTLAAVEPQGLHCPLYFADRLAHGRTAQESLHVRMWYPVGRPSSRDRKSRSHLILPVQWP